MQTAINEIKKKVADLAILAKSPEDLLRLANTLSTLSTITFKS